jgi:hypothetical protein
MHALIQGKDHFWVQTRQSLSDSDLSNFLIPTDKFSFLTLQGAGRYTPDRIGVLHLSQPLTLSYCRVLGYPISLLLPGNVWEVHLSQTITPFPHLRVLGSTNFVLPK